ncbi:penicillin acylase family protein [Qipengyuania oceanensis]|uniref:Penicillin acylase family protein n=1 Tax=Qipengyuania oceanensis TaxID=1463597 RepID=A0A844YD12_9SPHN|nr:penicillin acylase family protein [Qipengyuania oceanensis]MXO61445.1 penicillin acylase family protein [Qipengyuania oceanensis]
MARAQRPEPARRTLSGLHGRIRIREDGRGIPHVEARSTRDAFFAQGWLVARDRLFQIDLERRQQLGRMAEVFGEAFVPGDTAARLLHYRGDLDAELAGIPHDVRLCVEGYIAGVNARIAECLEDRRLLPPEYTILGTEPIIWTMRDMIRIRGLATSNASDEIRRAMLAARGMLAFDHYYEPLRPSHDPIVPRGLDLAAVGPEDLGMLGDLLPASFEHQGQYDVANFGSNAWTVAGSRTECGRPILANDPHLAIGGFGPRHMVHLTAPGLDVIGAGFPGLPGIMQGHTDRYAFGRTNFHIDQTDLMILETDPARPDHFRYRGEWVGFERHEEAIEVRDGASRTVETRYANGWPVIASQPDRNRAVCAATVSMTPGANMRFAIVALNLAKDWDDLREAFRLHVSPTNFHYADVEGNIGWHAIGYAPRRSDHDGLLPAPGDGSHDWHGLLEMDEMPSIFNPEAGWIASANACNIPASYPFAQRSLSYTWNDPYRHDRIAEVLSAQDRHTLADSIALMHDVQSLPARALQKLLPRELSDGARKAADMLLEWDCDVHADSAAALLYEVTLPILRAAFREMVIPEAARDLIPTVNLSAMLETLADPGPALGEKPSEARDALLDRALAEGWQRAIELGGEDPAAWRWGDLHRVEITHPLSAIPAVAETYPAITGGRSGGDTTTVMARGMAPAGGWEVRHGASFLFATQAGNWDAGRYLLLPGQSLEAGSPHYRDFYADWLAGDMQPMAFSEDAVAAATTCETIIEPAG